MTDPSSITRGGSVTFLGQVLKLGIHLLGLVLLARFLSPTEFGLVAMVSIFMLLSQLLRDAGLPMASLQASSLSKAQSSNMFWINASLGLVLGGALCLSSPLIVELFQEPQLQAIIPPLALVIFLNGLQAQIQVHLARSYRYNKLVISELSAQVLSTFIAVLVAYLGFGVWALVLQQILYAFALLVFRSVASGFHVGLPRKNTNTKPLLVNSMHLGGAQLLNWAATSVDSLAVGVASGPTALGLYDRSVQLLSGPMGTIVNALTQVIIPGARRAKQRGVTYEISLLRVQSIFGVFLFWVLLSAALCAPAYIPLLLGNDWKEMILLFQIISLGGCFRLLGFSSFWSFILMSASREQLVYALISRSLVVALIIGGAFFGGVLGVACGYSLGLVSNWIIGLLWVWNRVGVPMRRMARNATYYLLVGAVSLLSASLISVPFSVTSQLMEGLFLFVAFTVIFFVLHALFPTGRAAFSEAKAILTQSLG